jgi:predicted DNA-binding protein
VIRYEIEGYDRRDAMSETTSLRVEGEVLRRFTKISKQIGMSRNRLMTEALETYLANYDRLRIDKEFEGMADDVAYQREALEICEAFKYADAEVNPPQT